MRKGWKTRIPERMYFEEKREKRENRENKRAFLAKVQRKIEEDMKEHLHEMKEHNATH